MDRLRRVICLLQKCRGTPQARWNVPVNERRRDIALLFATRFARMFAYGLVSIVLVLYLTRIGFDEKTIGLLLSLTLAGDMLISLWMTTRADRMGRRKMLIAGAVLMTLAGLVFVSTTF